LTWFGAWTAAGRWIFGKEYLVDSFWARLGIDRAVFFTLLTRGWSIGAGLLTIVLVTRFLSPNLQGYYYTFNSLIALQIFVELGLTVVIVQFASHEMAHLAWTAEGTVSGNPQSKRRLQSLMHFALTWFGVAALLLVAVLLPVGWYFFGNAPPKGAPVPGVGWAWALLVIPTAVNLVVSAAVSVLEGCGKVEQIAVLRLWQSVFAVTASWLVLSFGGSLYALAANSLMTALLAAIWLYVKYRRFLRDILAKTTGLPGLDWRHELWPFQWRIALSWMSGYLIFHLFNPLLFASHGPVVAGQMGMSLTIISAMNGAAMAWISTKTPMYGQLVATRQVKALDTLFFRGFIQSFSFLLIGVCSVLLLFRYLSLAQSPYATRVLPLPLFSLLGLVCLANHIVYSEGAYLRAHKQEPFMALSIISGVATSILALLLVPPFGAAGAVYSYATSAMLICLCGGTVVFFRKRREWASNRSGFAQSIVP